MNTMKICFGCQKPLEANAPDGLCPECLLKAGLGTGVDLGPDSQAESGRTSFVAPSLEEVARLFPQLEILGFIGQGGMGAVYKARQKALDRVVALKILPPGIGKDATFAERFTREAKALAKLNHTGIVTLYEFGQADGLFFFLMEFVDGMNLRHLMEVERISAREALAIVPQICDALQYAHDQGIVHRDIKPENILLNRQGRVKVADFGLAKLVGTDAGAMPTPALSPGGGEGGTVLTEAGKVMGTPSYMAPEQSEHPSEVDHRADIYALGVVFYQMLTGELPGRPLQPPSSKVQIDVRLDEIVLRALEKKPELRYQQVSELKTRVETIAATPPAISSGRESAPTHSAGGLGSQHSVGAAPPPASQDRFWRRFALALAAVVLAPILILVGVALLGMILGVLSGARPQNQQSTHSVARSTNALPATVQTLTAPAPSARTRPAPAAQTERRDLAAPPAHLPGSRLQFRLVADANDPAPADTLADPAKPGAPIDAEKLRRLAWGPAATNGLRAACYFEPTKETYADGEVVKRWMVLHNSGKEPVRFDVGLGGHDDGWTVVDEQGQKVPLDHVAYAGLVPVATFVLEPGHATEIECMSTGMGASTKAAYPADTAIQAKPGTTCRVRWTLSVAETRRVENGKGVPGAGVWHGTLTTGEVRFRIVGDLGEGGLPR